jgi:hypothetical protein
MFKKIIAINISQKYPVKYIEKQKSGFIFTMSGFSKKMGLILRMIQKKCPVLFLRCPILTNGYFPIISSNKNF